MASWNYMPRDDFDDLGDRRFHERREAAMFDFNRKEGAMTPQLYRQGDVLLVPVDELPAVTSPVRREDGRVVLAHGEVTGHHHSIVEPDVRLVSAGQAEELRVWLLVDAPAPVALTHQEHATIMVPPGSYEVRRQREYTPERVVNVAD